MSPSQYLVSSIVAGVGVVGWWESGVGLARDTAGMRACRSAPDVSRATRRNAFVEKGQGVRIKVELGSPGAVRCGGWVGGLDWRLWSGSPSGLGLDQRDGDWD